MDNINYDPKVLTDKIEYTLKLYPHAHTIISAIPYRYNDPKMKYPISLTKN